MKNYLLQLFQNAKKDLSYIDLNKISFSTPKDKKFGDLSTNFALIISKTLGRNTIEVANEIKNSLNDDKKYLTSIDIAGNGFINFTFNSSFISDKIKVIISEGEKFGRNYDYKGKNALVEFVSANPTGPLTVGHGRNAILGDTIANLLFWIGYNVEREYYFNNAGRQMRVLGDSVRLRYLILCGVEKVFPDDYYQGEYIIDIAKKIYDEKKDSLVNDEIDFFKEYAEKEIFLDIQNTLKSIKINFDFYFNENSLYQDGSINDVLKRLDDLGYIYKKDDAVWFSLTKLGKDVDKVLVKNTGEPTYRLPDIAYHVNKMNRKYDLMVDIFGSDHIDTYPDVLSGLKVLGYDDEKVKVIIHQFVTVLRDNEVVKMSTRKANFITLDWLIDEVGADVVRYFFLMRTPSTHLNFDIDLAKKNSEENPVFYLQYAHARLCGILRLANENNLKTSDEFNLLNKLEEQELIKHLSQFPEIVMNSAIRYDILLLINYLNTLAEKFHKFYHEHRVISDDKNLSSARLSLCKASQIVLSNGLKILGIEAPERM